MHSSIVFCEPLLKFWANTMFHIYQEYTQCYLPPEIVGDAYFHVRGIFLTLDIS